MGAARPVIAAASAANAAIGGVDMAEALREAGLVTEAERLLREAARAFHANGMPQARAEAELHLARSLLRHDPAEAARVAVRHGTSRRWERGRRHRARGVQLRAQLSGGTIGSRQAAPSRTCVSTSVTWHRWRRRSRAPDCAPTRSRCD
ncbi:hypothetical protein [Microbacterium aurum]